MAKGLLNFTADIGQDLKDYCKQNDKHHIVFICDSNTRTHCLPYFSDAQNVIEITPGEGSKNIESYTYIIGELIGFKTGRSSLIVNLGGGVVTDLGAYAASTYMRGIDFVNIPTTLLGMVDAAIGGKTGIDFMSYKNYLGTFALPERIFIFQDFLKTLPETEMRGGVAEIIKCGIIANERLFKGIKADESLESLIHMAAHTKQDITDKDLYDKGERQLLNFGHTIGHAFESDRLEKGTPVHHGFAVAKGMMAESRLAFRMGLIGQGELDDILSCIVQKTGQDEITLLEFQSFCHFLQRDKKNNSEAIVFSLPTGIGKGKTGVSTGLNDIQNLLFNA